MANIENLKMFTSDQSREEAAKNGRKGGIASGEAKRRKKTMREAAEMMLQISLSEEEKKKLKEKGYDSETQCDALVAAAFQGAKRGNSQMFANLMRLLGEGTEQIELTVSDDSSKAMETFFDNERKNFKSDSE